MIPNIGRIKELWILFLSLFLYILFSECNHHCINVYNESDYILVRTDSSNKGLERKFYIYKYDSSRKMLVNYYYDGKILGKGFSYKGKLEGEVETFGYDGRLLGIDSFHNGIKISSKSSVIPDTLAKFFKNGTLQPLTKEDIDSLLK